MKSKSKSKKEYSNHEEELEDDDIHSFKPMNGNYTLCEQLYRTIGFNKKLEVDILLSRKITQYNDEVTCPNCKRLLNGQNDTFASIQRRFNFA